MTKALGEYDYGNFNNSYYLIVFNIFFFLWHSWDNSNVISLWETFRSFQQDIIVFGLGSYNNFKNQQNFCKKKKKI